MPSQRSNSGCLLPNVLCAVICVPLFLWLLPDVKETRDEARRIQAHSDVMFTALVENGGELPSNASIEAADPWGNPYCVTRDDKVVAHVASAGADGVFATDEALPNDDITSDMLTSPSATMHAKKNRQLLIAFVTSAVAWLVLFLLMRETGRARLRIADTRRP
jgi:hypothetical protein